MKMNPEEMTRDELEAARRSAKIKRRTGFAIALVATAYLTVPMLIGAFGGVARGEVWDPFTGEPLEEGAVAQDGCLKEAEELIAESGELRRLHPTWDDRVTNWQVRCREDYPHVSTMVTDSRRKLRGRAREKKVSGDSEE